MKFNHKSPYMLTDNEENTFTLKPINCYNGQCAIELKVNGKKMTNAEMAGIGQIRISREHLQAVSMKGMIHQRYPNSVIVRVPGHRSTDS